MTRTYRLLLLFALAIACASPAGVDAEPLQPTCSIRIDSGSFLADLGFRLIEATIELKGKLFRIRFYGISSDPDGYHASGQIYGLTDIDDIVGRYEVDDQGKVLISEAGVEIVLDRTAKLTQEYVYVDYLGTLYARHDQSVQFGPRY